MSAKVLKVLVVSSILLGLASCGDTAARPADLPAAEVPADLTLVPYASPEYGFTGIMPSGWVEFSPGHYQPAVPSAAPTLFVQLGLPGVSREQIDEIAAFPESAGKWETSTLTWDLYVSDFQVPGESTIVMEFALTEAGGGVYAVVLGASADGYAELRERLFLPALEALQPTDVTASAEQSRAEAVASMPIGGEATPIDTRIRAADGMVMVYVPAGEFEMGQDAVWRWSGSLWDSTLGLQAQTDQRPQHGVYLDAFWIDQTEVTVGMFRAFVDATGYVTTAERQGYGHPYRAGPKEQEWPSVPGADWRHPRGPGSTALDEHPVVQVSWDDAAAYCAWAGGALPTEAQWEKACRGTDARAYPWGNAFDQRRLNYCDAQCPVDRWSDPEFDDGYEYTSPAGSYRGGASPYGVLDMAGNVWEWTSDRYDARYYDSAPYKNPQGPATGDERVQHGGAWYDGGQAGWLTCTVRHATRPTNAADDLGFRCAVPVLD